MNILDLNEDCLENIFNFLDLENLNKINKINSEFNELIDNNNYLWKNIFLKIYKNVSLKYLVEDYFSEEIIEDTFDWKNMLYLFSKSNLLLVVVGGSTYYNRQLTIISKDQYTIGRSRKNDLTYLYCDEISRFHISIIKKYGHYWLLDNNSSNGTRINNILVPYNVMVKLINKDVIEIGFLKIKIFYIL
jgi:hypothetical protein